MSHTTIQAQTLTIYTQDASGREYKVLGYKFETGFVLIVGDVYDIFFEGIETLKIFGVGGGYVISVVEERQERVFTERDLLDSVFKAMNFVGARNIPMMRILLLLYKIHSSG